MSSYQHSDVDRFQSESCSRQQLTLWMGNAGKNLIRAIAIETIGIEIILEIEIAEIELLDFKVQVTPETQSIPVVLIVPGAKWFSSQQLRQLKVVSAIDDSVTPLELPLAIAKLLRWGKEFDLTR